MKLLRITAAGQGVSQFLLIFHLDVLKAKTMGNLLRKPAWARFCLIPWMNRLLSHHPKSGNIITHGIFFIPQAKSGLFIMAGLK